MFPLLKWVVTFVAAILNFFVYFYPDIVNGPGVCQWADHVYEWKYPVLNQMVPLRNQAVQTVLLNFPLVRKEKDYSKEEAIHMLTFGDPQINGNWRSTKAIKRLDNYGNDHYLGHIYRTMQNRLAPSHVAVMGDQFLSQWILDSEFYNRTHRFVNRLFPRDLEYKATVEETWSKHEDYDWVRWLQAETKMLAEERFSLRNYNDVYDWVYPERSVPNHDNPLFVNLTGNHDIGYSGDATWQHMARFHHLFGQNNYVITYNRGTPAEWRMVVLDSLTLDGPALQEEFREFTWGFLNSLNASNLDFHGSTVLLTHIPMFKKAGLCADGPDHRWYENYAREPYKNGKLRSQNHLSYESTQKVLDVVFPNKEKPGLILTGHDHVGCSSYYSHVNGEWVGEKTPITSDRAPIHEVVVRAMMGEYDGQTGIVTGVFNKSAGYWDFHFSYCSFVIQHWWWASKVAALVSLLLHSVAFLTR